MSRFRAWRAWWAARPFAADAVVAAGALIVGVAIPVEAPQDAPAWVWVSRLLTALACGALVVRRQWPLPVLAVAVAATMPAAVAQLGPSGVVLPLVIALYTVGAWCPARFSLPAAAVSVALVIGVPPLVHDSAWSNLSANALAAWLLLFTMVGVAVRSQRRALLAARERARIAEESREEEAHRRVAEERMRIARELHDLVAHRISVVNVQSGVAEHLITTDPDAAREAIGHVRSASAEVLREMSTLLGLLRTSGEGSDRESAPGLAGLDALVESFRRTGLQISLRESGPRPVLAPLVDVTAYRVVEEALTNARRHGADGAVDVSISQSGGITGLEVRNRVDDRPTGEPGFGLVGMRERVTALGGLVTAGRDAHGWFVVRAELPTVTPVGDGA